MYRYSTLVAKYEITKAMDDSMLPNMATVLNPNLFAKALTKGPTNK